MNEPDDAEIACGLRSGSTTAWCALYDRHAAAVWRLVARLMGGASSDVADVVQETFLAAAKSAGGYDSARGSLWVWLSGIARRQVAIHFRTRKRNLKLYEAAGRPAIERERIVAWLENRASQPIEECARSETAELVRAALVEVPDEHGALLVRRYLEQTDINELAANEACTVTAMRSRLARARRAFRNVLSALAPSLADPQLVVEQNNE